ncbi:MAG: response regulator [Desulfobacteraceae bacterium]|nr:response regulator [Desulfobacteraceae bacterium]
MERSVQTKKKPPSFKRFLLIMVFILQGLSLAVVIFFLYGLLDDAMEHEYINQLSVQQAELRIYLSNRITHIQTRVREISANNNLKVSLLLGLHSKVSGIMESLYPAADGAYYYLRYAASGMYCPDLSLENNHLQQIGKWSETLDRNFNATSNPSQIVFSVPIFDKSKLLGHIVGLYDLSQDPQSYNLLKAFGHLELVRKNNQGYVDIYANRHYTTQIKTLNHFSMNNQLQNLTKNDPLLIPVKEFPSLYLMTTDIPLAEKRSFIVKRLALICIPLFLLTITVTFFILRKITSTLATLANNALSIAQNDEQTKLDEQHVRHAEFIYFTQAFNRVLGKMRRRSETLVQVNQSLQSEIKERSRMANALQKSEAQLRSLQSNIPIGLFRKTIDGQLVFVNPKCLEIFGYSKTEEMLALPMEQFFDSQDDYQNLIDAIEEKEEVQAMEIRFQRKDGTLIWCAIHLKRLVNKSSGGLYLDGAILDITDRKRVELEKQSLEMQLRQSQKMEAIGTLAGGIAHDFNNILAAIDGFSDLSLDDAPKDSLLYDNIKEIRIATQRATDLVKQILTFARQSDVEKRPIKFAIILKETIKLLRSTIPSNIDIQTELNTQKIIMADPTQLHQIIVNLCTNAGHSMRQKNGILKVHLKETSIRANSEKKFTNVMPGRYFMLSIIDNGHGMPKEVLDRIFDPYFTTKQQGEGTGMGLSVVQGIIHSMRGAIHVNSEVGKGSTFDVYLPVLEKQSQPREVFSGPLVGGTEHILFVDDEIAITQMGQQMLERLGYKVTVSNNSLEALDIIRNSPDLFDLVLSDMTMPKLTGDKFAKEVMSIRKDMPIILCTGYSDQIDQQRALSQGVHALLEKPIVKHELDSVIRSAIRNRNNATGIPKIRKARQPG